MLIRFQWKKWSFWHNFMTILRHFTSHLWCKMTEVIFEIELQWFRSEHFFDICENAIIHLKEQPFSCHSKSRHCSIETIIDSLPSSRKRRVLFEFEHHHQWIEPGRMSWWGRIEGDNFLKDVNSSPYSQLSPPNVLSYVYEKASKRCGRTVGSSWLSAYCYTCWETCFFLWWLPCQKPGDVSGMLIPYLVTHILSASTIWCMVWCHRQFSRVQFDPHFTFFSTQWGCSCLR